MARSWTFSLKLILGAGALIPALLVGCGDIIDIGWETPDEEQPAGVGGQGGGGTGTGTGTGSCSCDDDDDGASAGNGAGGQGGEGGAWAICDFKECSPARACELPGACSPETGDCTLTGKGLVWENNYLITDAASVEGLAGYSDIIGALLINENTTVTELSLPGLAYVGAGVYVSKSPLTSLDLGDLESVGGALRIEDNSALTSVNLGKLASACEEVYFDLNDALVSVDLSALHEAGSNISFRHSAIPSLDLSSLELVDNLELYYTSIESVSLTSLKQIDGSLVLDHNELLGNLGPSALEGVHGYFYADHNSSLTSFNLQSLEIVWDYMSVTNNGLTSLGFGGLKTVGQSGYFVDNPSLPSCSVTAILPVFEDIVTNTGNNGAGPCL